MPTTVIASIGSRTADSVTVNSVSSTTVTGYTNAWSVVLSATVPSTTKIGDKVTVSSNSYLITGISSATLTAVGDAGIAFTSTSTPGTGSATTERAYTTPALWASGAPSNLTTQDSSAGWIWKGEVYKEGGGTDNEWEIGTFASGNRIATFTATTSSTCYFIMTAAAGQSFLDNANKLTNALRYSPANGVSINNLSAYAGIEGTSKVEITNLQIKLSILSNVYFYGTNGDCLFRSCILFQCATTEAVSSINCLWYGRPQPISNGGSPWFHRNSTFIGDGTGAFGNAGNAGLLVKNCAFFAFTSIGAQTDTTNSTYNATDLSSFGWTATGNIVSKTFANQFQNTGSGTEDFRVKAAADLINAGVRDQTYTNDLDVVSQTRSTSTPTIGAWEYLSVPAAPTGVTAGSVTAYSVTASWTDASSDETGFKVQYAPSPYSSWTAFSGSPTAANATTLASGNVLTPGTSYKIRVASTNANGDSAFVESGVFTTTPLTFLRPIADTSNGAWTASSGSDRYAMIDESSTNDADYITVSTASTYKTRLTTVSDPGVDTDHSVVVRAKGDGSSQLTIALVQGDPTETAIASTTVTPTVGYADYTQTVTSGQAANITDYSLLYLKLTSL